MLIRRVRHASLIAGVVLASLGSVNLGGVALASPAEESPGRVAAAPVEFIGELDDTQRNSATSGLLAGLERSGLSVLGPEDIARAFPDDPACEGVPCRNQIASGGGSELGAASYVLRTTVEKVDADFQVKLELITPEGDATAATVEAVCEICGAQELGERISDAAASMQPRIEALRPKVAVLHVDGSPAGAKVFIDGAAAGETPLTVEVAPGEHVLRVEKSAYVTQERNWQAAAGVRERISYDLAEAAKAGPHPAIGWTLFGLGAGAVGAGVPLLVIDESPYESNCGGVADVNGRCPERYATREAGIVFAAVGGAAVIAGIVTLVYAYRNKKKSRIGVASSGLAVSF